MSVKGVGKWHGHPHSPSATCTGQYNSDSVVVQSVCTRVSLPARHAVPSHHPLHEVLDVSLEAKVLRSDNSALAKDCRKEMKALNAQLLKLQGGLEVLCKDGWGVPA